MAHHTSPTINISLPISAHLRSGIKRTGIFLTKVNAPSSLPPLTLTSLTGGLMSQNEQGVMEMAAQWDADGVMSVAYYLQGQL